MIKITVLASALVIVVVTLVLVALLLFVKDRITPKGTVRININDGKKELDAAPGGNLMATLAEHKIFLPSACGGKANCGQCKVQVFEGGEKSCPPKPASSTASRSRKAGGWAARSR